MIVVERTRLIAALRRLFTEPGASATEPIPDFVFTAPDITDAVRLRSVLSASLPRGALAWERDPAGSLARFAFTRSFNLPVALSALPELCAHPAIGQVEPGGPGHIEPMERTGKQESGPEPALSRFFAGELLPALALRNPALARGEPRVRAAFLAELARILELPLPGIGRPLAGIQRIDADAGAYPETSAGPLADRFAAAAIESWRPGKPGIENPVREDRD